MAVVAELFSKPAGVGNALWPAVAVVGVASGVSGLVDIFGYGFGTQQFVVGVGGVVGGIFNTLQHAKLGDGRGVVPGGCAFGFGAGGHATQFVVGVSGLVVARAGLADQLTKGAVGGLHQPVVGIAQGSTLALAVVGKGDQGGWC